MIFKNNKGAAVFVIIFATFLMLTIVNINILLNENYKSNEKRILIKNKIENSYSQSLNIYIKDFNRFCKTSDFINPHYKPEKLIAIIPVNPISSENKEEVINNENVNDNENKLFKVEEIQNDNKIALNSIDLSKEEALGIMSLYIKNEEMIDEITKYLNDLNSSQGAIYYIYSNKNIFLENVIKLM